MGVTGRHDSSGSGSESEEEGKPGETAADPRREQELLRKRQELEDSDASIDFSKSEEEPKPEASTLQTKLEDIKVRGALSGKHAQTVVRDKDGQVADLKDARQVKLAEVRKLNRRIVA